VLAATALGLAVGSGYAESGQEGAARVASVAVEVQERGPGRGPGPGRGEPTVEQTDRVVHTLAIGPTGLLELRNLAGNITVTAAAGREARIEIVRRSRGRTEADAKMGLERSRVTVDHKGERAMVVVEPGSDRRPPYFVTVTYTVSAPAGTRITASSLSGDVTVSDIKGEINALVTRGNVDIRRASLVSAARTISGNVTLMDLDSNRGVVVNALSGDVQLERVRARRVEVDVTSGDVALSAITSDTVRLASLSGSLTFAGELMRGGRYQFKTHSGNIRIRLTGSTGADLQASTFRGSLRLDPSLKMTAPLEGRGSLRGTVGDGAATLEATTFSGDVEISR
jgi:hypothetical protein